MDFAGLVKKFPSNRPLSDQEKDLQLKQKQPLNINPHHQVSVIEMNSTYLESVDKWYGEKGTITALMLILVLIFSVGSSAMLYVAVNRDPADGSGNKDLAIMIFVGITTLPLISAAIWGLLKESFAFTHYPMRFNRKTRMVHVFRTNGTILTAPWDDIFFTLMQVDHGYKFWNIMGHVIGDDNITITESFALSVTSDGSSDGIKILRSHWEFMRRYMESGPEAVTGQVEFCLPINNRRESIRVATRRLFGESDGNGMRAFPINIFSLVFYTIVWPFRFIAMITSKLPRWPADIESASAIEIGDPYAIVGTATGHRTSLYPEAVVEEHD
jgi:hypothetical protein